jgi:hypothetical protein
MPFKSEAQRRLFHAKEGRGEMSHKTVEEWEHATKNKKELPYHKKEASPLVLALLDELEKIAAGVVPNPLSGAKAAVMRAVKHPAAKAVALGGAGGFALGRMSKDKESSAMAKASKKLKKLSMGTYC